MLRRITVWLLSRLSQQDVVTLLISHLRPPKRQQKMSEFGEAVMFKNLATDEFRVWLENESYDEMVAHLNASSPEERLIKKGRYSAYQDLFLKCLNARDEVERLDIEESISKSQ